MSASSSLMLHLMPTQQIWQIKQVDWVNAAVVCCTWNTSLGNGSSGVILSREDVTAGPLNLRKRFGSMTLVPASHICGSVQQIQMKQHCSCFIWDRETISNHFLFQREAFHVNTKGSQLWRQHLRLEKCKFTFTWKKSDSYHLHTLKCCL